jgi:hypothetical protein
MRLGLAFADAMRVVRLVLEGAAMHTVELLEEAMEVARRLGYHVRVEPLEGHAGYCVVAGKKLLLVDLAAGPAERLDTVLDALREDAAIEPGDLSPTLQRLLGRHKAAA